MIENRHLAAGAQAEYAAQFDNDLRLVGIEVESVADSDLFISVFEERNFDTAWLAYCHGEDPAIGVRRQFHSDDISAGAFTNAAGYRNSTVDSRWDEVVVLPPSSPSYRIRRERIQNEVAGDLPYVWVAEIVDIFGHRQRVRTSIRTTRVSSQNLLGASSRASSADLQKRGSTLGDLQMLKDSSGWNVIVRSMVAHQSAAN